MKAAVMSAPTTFERTPSRFFAALTVAERVKVLRAGSRRQYPPRTAIFHEGDSAEHLFLLADGEARLFSLTHDGRKVILFWVTPGEVFGGAALLPDPGPYLASAETVRASHAYVWDRDTIRKLAADNPRLWENGLTIASDYLTWYSSTHLALVCRSARERLAQALLTLAQGIGHVTQAGISLDVTNEELASVANVTLFTASRILSQWHRGDAIVKERGRILLRKPEGLR